MNAVRRHGHCSGFFHGPNLCVHVFCIRDHFHYVVGTDGEPDSSSSTCFIFLIRNQKIQHGTLALPAFLLRFPLAATFRSNAGVFSLNMLVPFVGKKSRKRGQNSLKSTGTLAA